MHRDVKPGNILVRTDGMVKLTDFGIAKAADAVPVTRSGMVMGTAHYIAPEQASGAEAGPAGDVYSLGIVGYECLVGHRPFRAESAVAVAMMQVRDAPPPLPGQRAGPGPRADRRHAGQGPDPALLHRRRVRGGGGRGARAASRLPVPASISGSAPVLTPAAPGPPVRAPPATTGHRRPPAAGRRRGPGHDRGPRPRGRRPRRPPLGPRRRRPPIVPLELRRPPDRAARLLVVLFVLLTWPRWPWACSSFGVG